MDDIYLDALDELVGDLDEAKHDLNVEMEHGGKPREALLRFLGRIQLAVKDCTLDLPGWRP